MNEGDICADLATATAESINEIREAFRKQANADKQRRFRERQKARIEHALSFVKSYEKVMDSLYEIHDFAVSTITSLENLRNEVEKEIE